MSDTYIIKGETLTDTADALRRYLFPTGDSDIVRIDPNVCKDNPANRLVLMGGIRSDVEFIKAWEEWDAQGPQANIQVEYTALDKEIWAWGYAPDNLGNIVIVLCGIYGDLFYYVGDENLGGITVNRWRLIENPVNVGFTALTWESEEKKFILTDPIVVGKETSPAEYNPTDFPEKIAEVYAAGAATAPTYENANEEVY